ncbi:MAG: M23 family metallopeptidase [Rhodospirillales bacterium]|nr:M23 family metallopeptidase [Rhodospirillales bacterium]
MKRLSLCGSAGPAALLLLLVAALPARAEAPRLNLPVACEIGRECWIIQYFDADPGPGWRDYTCNARSYDKHTGTDFGIRDRAAMVEGVAVLAAAAGRVAAIRDGVEDKAYDRAAPGDVKDRECGNAVRIDHGEGWQTLYCHLRRDSVMVRSGQEVRTGQRLGMIGQSGAAQFPHVHLGVMHNGRMLDPFRGEDSGASETCGLASGHLWNPAALPELTYSGFDITHAGFADRMPEMPGIEVGQWNGTVLPAQAEIITFWSVVYGVRTGDRVTLRLVGPNGETIAEQALEVDRNQARIMRAVGRKRRGEAWPAGEYRGEITVARGTERKQETRRLTVR